MDLECTVSLIMEVYSTIIILSPDTIEPELSFCVLLVVEFSLFQQLCAL